MITSKLLEGTTLTAPELVFTASKTGAPVSGSVLAQDSAITTIALCNTETPNLEDETDGGALVNIYLVRQGQSISPMPSANLIVNRIYIPAGETVFFNDERIILDGGDRLFVGCDSANRIAVTVSSIAV